MTSTSMNRREALQALVIGAASSRIRPAKPAVSTLIGTGAPGYSDREVNNPYGLVIGPDQALYFCDLDNQRIRRLDLRTRQTTTVAGDGQKAYRGDGGPAAEASLNMPHEIQFDSSRNLYIAERDNHVIRKVDAKTGIISTFAGTGAPGFITTVLGTGRRGDGPEPDPLRCALARPHGVLVDAAGFLYVGDSEAHRIRVVH